MSMLAVRTDVFEGPLDLLLHLIEKEDLDITAVSLVAVTDQYLAMLRRAENIDLRALADFVATGARLLYLKSRALLPRTPDQVAADAIEAEEIAQDLTEQLQEYRAFKNAASYLRDLDAAGHRSFSRVAALPPEWMPTGLERVTMKKLLSTLAKALERLPPAPEPERLQRVVINVAERREAVLANLRRGAVRTFGQLIAACRSRLEAIVTFLAVLDLLKSEDVVAVQSETFGEIDLRLPGAPEPAFATA
jgi:segregation and condensation protein A